MNDENDDFEGRAILIPRKCEPRVHCVRNNSYIIVGGLGGMGMELTDWLILRGARNIVLSSRTGIKNGYQSYRIKLWRSYGVKIVIFTEDLANEIGVRNLLDIANTLGPVEGIFNLAMILIDDPFVKQTKETFSLTNKPKVTLTMHLDNLSRKMCSHLRYFVVFSSIACGLGNQNQSNYAFANSAMERICEIRHKDGLPSLAIQWGAVGDVGVVAEFQEHGSGSEIIICGALQQKIKSCFETLNIFMKQSSDPIVASVVVAEKNLCDSIDIVSTVANVLGIKDLKTINQSWTFSELGMDSVLALELKQILNSQLNIIFSPEDLQNMTFVKLHRIMEGKENISKADENKMTPQVFTFINEILLNKSIRRIPINENHNEKPINFDENPTIFMFPGLGGSAIPMQTLAKNLPGQVICFQYYFGEIADFSEAELHDYLAKYILENFNLDQEFCIIGHSMGGLIALEVADILEKHGKTGYLYLIESSPAFALKVRTEENDERVEIEICSSIMSMFSPTMSTKEFTQLIKNTNGWQSKKKLCLSLVSPELTNEKVLNLIFDKIYNGSKAIRNYKIPKVSLESPGVLMRCVKNPLDDDDAYGLAEYFKNPIQIHKIDAGHNSILHHPKTSQIVLDSPFWKKKSLLTYERE